MLALLPRFGDYKAGDNTKYQTKKRTMAYLSFHKDREKPAEAMQLWRILEA